MYVMAWCDQCVFLCFFFFQAEDGIRDATVTGVQTCALPIYTGEERHEDTGQLAQHEAGVGAVLQPPPDRDAATIPPRSEERRVGKSVDLGGGPIIKKKKKRKRNTGKQEWRR